MNYPVDTSLKKIVNRDIRKLSDRDLTDRVIRTADPAERYRTRIVKKLSLSFFRGIKKSYRNEMFRRMAQ